MKTTYELMREQPLLAGLNDWQLEHLAADAQRAIIHAGNRVFREGDPADRMWLIVDGRIDVDTRLPDRGDVIIDTLGPGDVLGWSWLFPPYRWHFGAVARETALTVELDGPRVRELCQRDPGLGYHFITGLFQVVTDRLQATRRRLIDEMRTGA
ncbi:MAG TPA: cyclic nucleotide-binding domain-containing protein [Actinoplanes sp.]|nr:cyclic nucleotide-binding domain-containing protein [Actinoplanes sp.]